VKLGSRFPSNQIRRKVAVSDTLFDIVEALAMAAEASFFLFYPLLVNFFIISEQEYPHTIIGQVDEAVEGGARRWKQVDWVLELGCQ
jgi:hypothetical protein